MTKKMTRTFNDDFDRRLENFLEEYMEDKTFEEFIEEFDMVPSDVFLNMYYSGLIDDRDLERVFPRLMQ